MEEWLNNPDCNYFKDKESNLELLIDRSSPSFLNLYVKSEGCVEVFMTFNSGITSLDEIKRYGEFFYNRLKGR